MSLILQEVSAEPRDRDPRAGARGLQALAPDPAVPGAAAGARARYARPHLLQVRGRLAPGLAQGQHRGGAGLRERRRRDQEADHRDRRRAVGLGAGLRLPDVRARVRGVDGRLQLRPEAVPPLDDADLGRHGASLAVGPHRGRACPERAPHRLAGHRHLRGGRGRRAGPRRQLLAGLGAQPRAAAPDGHRAGGDRADGDGRRVSGRRRRLRRRRLELRRTRLPVPAPQHP